MRVPKQPSAQQHTPVAKGPSGNSQPATATFADNRAATEQSRITQQLAKTYTLSNAIQISDKRPGTAQLQTLRTVAPPSAPVIQGNFYLKGPNNTFIWHAEAPNTRLYEPTGQNHRPGFFSFSYPVYKNKLLDSRSYPNAQQDATMDAAKQSGVVPHPAVVGQVQTMAAVIGALTPVQKGQFEVAYDDLLNYCQAKDMAKIVEGALTNVRRGPLFDTSAPGGANENAAKALFLKRFLLMATFIHDVGEEPVGIGGQKIKDQYYIQSTGSDPHAGGKHALFLVSKANPNQRILYKPHSLKFEDAFIGKQGILSTLSATLSKSKKLPTLDINSKDHTESYVERTGHQGDAGYDLAKLQNHSHKLGMLEMAAQAFGVTDLHADNIIFGKDGPVPIDAEVGGNYGVGAETGIDDGVGPAKVSDMAFHTASSLYIGGNQQYPSDPHFQAGKLEMKNKLQADKKSILKRWRKHLSGVDSFRVVPIATNDLATYLNMALDPANENQIRQQFRNELTTFIQSNELATHWGLQITKKAAGRFYQILRDGTLPAFEFQMKTGQILMDGIPVAVPPQGTKVTQDMNVSKMSELAGAKIDAM